MSSPTQPTLSPSSWKVAQDQTKTTPETSSAPRGSNEHRITQANDVATHDAQQMADPTNKSKGKDKAHLEKLVQEENESRGELPRYPGLEQWELVEKIGEDGLSIVYRARHATGVGTEVAIKVVRKFDMNSPQRARILKEVQIMRELDHPNIIALLAFSESRQYYYIIMELATDGELFDQIARLEYFSEELARHIVIQVAIALHYLHKRGIVHRNIKPENILLNPIPIEPSRTRKRKLPRDEDKVDEGEHLPGQDARGIGLIKIAGFSMSELVRTTAPRGTIRDAAPGIVEDESYSKTTDIWALGCILYTILCGFPPFYDENIEVLTDKLTKEQPTFLSPWWDNISKSAQSLVSHMLANEPKNRCTLAEFFAHPWVCRQLEPMPPDEKSVSENMLSTATVFRPGDHDKRVHFQTFDATFLRQNLSFIYSVKLEDEEVKREKQITRQGNTASHSRISKELFEDDEEESDLSRGQDLRQRVRDRNRQNDIPEISLDRATLISRRAQMNADASPLTSMKAALGTGNAKVIERLLEKDFVKLATGDYAWLQELKDIGYSFFDMACLLVEQETDSPWIYFAPHSIETVGIRCDAHIPGCVHQILHPSHNDKTIFAQGATQSGGDYHQTLLVVQRLCGLAGITPVSRDQKTWNGLAEFSEENKTVTITYPLANEDFSSTAKLLILILDGLRSAIGIYQSRGYCCNSFTILQSTNVVPVQNYRGAPVEVCRIDLTSLDKFRESLAHASHASDVQTITLQILSAIFRPEGELTRRLERSGMDVLLPLTVQILCIGFISYCQAHIGALQLSFLDTPISKVCLLGKAAGSGNPIIEGHLVRLTCMGDMILQPVFAFSVVDSQSIPDGILCGHDLFASLEDTVDTWGPAQFVMPQEGHWPPLALIIGGGVIHAIDSDCTQLHWSHDFGKARVPKNGIDPFLKMIIGSLVSVNTKCQIDEEERWYDSSWILQSLGPYFPRWEYFERQVGMQAGEYFLLQANAAQQKVAGRTLKQHRLLQEDDALISFLDNLWGLQVSFCTGISRRVPLQTMVADMLPIFADAFISNGEDHAAWIELQEQHGITEKFRSGMARNCLLGLPGRLHRLALKMTRRIFMALAETGVDRSGKYMIVAWPRSQDIYRCFQIPCEHESAWTKVLADSTDCATFAYITTLCLETDTIRCQGPNAIWKGTMPLMETAVIGHHSTLPTSRSQATLNTSQVQTAPSSSNPIPLLLDSTISSTPKLGLSLQHNATHFFQKADHCFFVTVQRPDASSTPMLVARSSTLPPRIQWRVLQHLRGEERKRKSRLRERVIEGDAAELVSLSAIT
ncbi:hypothetical protein PFICI_10461 [Pestalotiopsis fici W106-1]|uniref:Protein kinase domain-containing protein n=1 Tax=Pestalotiopsis fici (strain W106-1 / CGMCC3.15140) TaxID=1229662 RepID=W3WX76_PESFW|nr:uncharacterized protein PFICI_10461 [Pestalotiopsis fici W106-1]ETS78399.1 hypothetical protein PFICI_10461 [Pestalotiopsis fici W106-1]